MDVEQLIDEVIAREGGFSNHPADRGGATRWG
jgi:lysozyme family protein